MGVIRPRGLGEGLQDWDLLEGTAAGPGLKALRGGVRGLLLGVGKGPETGTSC